jgi:opacity protein-like surface antigen
MRRYLASFTGAALAMLLPSAASAQDFAAPAPYIGMFGGFSHRGDERIARDYSLVSVDAEINFHDGAMAGLLLGARFGGLLRAEVELSGHWHDLVGHADIVPLIGPTLFSDMSGALDVSFLFANMWIDLPVHGAIRPYIGGGIGVGFLDVDVVTNAGNTVIDDENSNRAYQLGAGLGLDLAPHLALDIGYRYKAIQSMEFDAWTIIAPVTIEGHYKAHNLLVGLHFGL